MFTDSLANALALLLFNNTNFANWGDATGVRGSSSAGSLYVGGHTANPGKAGDQTTSEATYTGYARSSGVARSSGGWTISGDTITNAAAISLGACTGGSNTLTHWGLGTASSGAGVLGFYGPIIASGATWLPANGTASDDKLTIIGNPFSVDDRIVLETVIGGTLPAGITAGTVYWVKTSSGNTITISTTQGGSTLDITADGACMAIKATTLAVSNNITPQFSAGQLNIILRPSSE